MRLNHVTVTLPDLDAGWQFYTTLGLVPLVDSRPRYVRFLVPEDGTTLSLHHGSTGGGGTTIYFECDDLDARTRELERRGLTFSQQPADKPWLWREAELFAPGGNRILLFFAGENRIDPPWRIKD